MKKSLNLRKTLIVLLSTLCLVMISFTAGLAGVFSVKAEELEPTAGQFYMLDGAEVSMTDNCGMRFTTVITKEYYDKLMNCAGEGGSLTFYTEIGPVGFTPKTDYYTEELQFDENGEAKFYGVITYGILNTAQVKEEAAVDLTGKAFVVINYANETKSEPIPATRKDTTRSMRAVANMALLDGDYGTDTEAKAILENYLGKVEREEETQALTNRNTVVNFSEPVSGRVYLNAVRTNLFVSNTTEVDIKNHINWDKVDTTEDFTVSVFGNNGTSVYDVASKNVSYDLELVYKDGEGNLKSDYRVVASPGQNSYEPARQLVEIFERVTGVTNIVQYAESTGNTETSYLKNATIEGNYICIGVNNSFFKQTGLEYDKKELINGGFVIATKGNSIFLYGGDETVKYSEGDANSTAVFKFAEEYFNFVVTGVLPDPVEAKLNGLEEPSRGWHYYIDSLVFNHDDLNKELSTDKSAVSIKSGLFNKYIPDINRRSASYGTYTGTFSEALGINGAQTEDFLAVWSVTYEDYLKIADHTDSQGNKDGLAERQYTGSCGHVQYSATVPTSCTSSSCTVEDVEFEDTTATFAAYKESASYVCLTCGKLTVAFKTPDKCLANYNACVNKEDGHSCDGTSFDGVTSRIWHNSNYHLPIQNYVQDHPDWFGDDIVYRCSSCDATYNWTSYYYTKEEMGDATLTENDPASYIRAEEDRKCTCGNGTIQREYTLAENAYACDKCYYDEYSNKSVGNQCTREYNGVQCAGYVRVRPSVECEGANETEKLMAKIIPGSTRTPHKAQLCFNAHGNPEEYKLMVVEIAKNFLNNLKYVDHNDKGKLKDFGSITVIDGTNHCECQHCVMSFIKYGTMAGAVLKFTNDVSKLIEAWMEYDVEYIASWYGEAADSDNVKSWWHLYDDNGNLQENKLASVDILQNEETGYARPITLNFFAYTRNSAATSTSADRYAPVKYNESNGKYEAIDPSVNMYKGDYLSTGVYLVTSADTFTNIPKPDGSGNYTYDEIYAGGEDVLKGLYNGTDVIYKQINNSDEESTATRDYMVKWGDLSEGTGMYLWINTQDSKRTTFPYYSANLMDADMITFLNGIGAESVFFYAGAAEHKAVTAFGNLKIYVNAKQMWETGDHLETYTDKEAYLNELMNEWFDNTFIHEEVITKMQDAFTLSMQMAARAVYLRSNSSLHPHYKQDYNQFSVGNSDDYGNIIGPHGEYWDVNNLITLYNFYKDAHTALEGIYGATYNNETGDWECDTTANYVKFRRIKSMIDSEWYSPLMIITRYYLNDPAVIPNRAEYIAKFDEVIKETGVTYNGEYSSPKVPMSDVLSYSTKVEPVIYDFTGNTSAAGDLASKNTEHVEMSSRIVDGYRQYYKQIDGVETIIYDEKTGELNLFPGERYRVLLRVTEDIYNSSGVKIYSEGDLVVNKSEYFGYTKGMAVSTSGRYSERWPTYFGLAKDSSIIAQSTMTAPYKDYYYYSTNAAFEDQAWRKTNFLPGARDNHEVTTETIAGGTRNVAYCCDELNITYALCSGVPVVQRACYSIRINLYSAII